MFTLTTPRLLLRDFVEADTEAVYAYAGNPANVIYMAWGPNESLEQTRQFRLRAMEKASAEPREDYDLAVTLKSTGQLIGGCGISIRKDWHGRQYTTGNLGWILHMDHWKRGYGTEFAAEMIRFGFEELGLHRIYSSCDAENYGSYRVMERNGMRREATLKEAILGRDGAWHDQYEYAILREEWGLPHSNHFT